MPSAMPNSSKAAASCFADCCTKQHAAAVLRLATILAALLLFASPVFAIILKVELIAEGGASIDRSLGQFAINTSLAAASVLIVSAECHLFFIVKWFGFLAFRGGRGTTLVCIGGMLFAYARPAMADGNTTSAVFETVAGLFACFVGFINIGFALMPPCCPSFILPQDKLAEKFRALHSRESKAKRNLSAKQDVPDVEAGEGGAVATSKAAKKAEKAEKAAAVAAAKAAKKAVAKQPVTVDNPFLKRPPASGVDVVSATVVNSANPFLTVNRC